MHTRIALTALALLVLVLPDAVQAQSLTSAALHERWLETAFTHAEGVMVVRVKRADTKDRYGMVEAVAVEEIRGFRTPKQPRLAGLPIAERKRWTSGSRWIVATMGHGAIAEVTVIGFMKDSADNRLKAARWAEAAWSHTPILMTVKVANRPGIKGERVKFDVVEVLRGESPGERVVENTWGYERLRPFVPGPRLFLMSAWGVKRYEGIPHPMLWAAAMRPIETAEVAAWRGTVRQDPAAGVSAEKRALQLAKRAWLFRRAPYVAEVEVTSAFEEVSSLGGLHFTMAPRRWWRGEVEASKLPNGLRHHFPLASNRAVGAGGRLEPYLFYGGGHGHRGSEKVGDRFLAAGWKLGRASAMVPATASSRAEVRGWMSAPQPRFEAHAHNPAMFAPQAAPKPLSLGMRPGVGVFEPVVGLSALAGHGQDWIQFEVVARRQIKVSGQQTRTLIHCRQVQSALVGTRLSTTDQKAVEWVFEGPQMPDWPRGSRWWGVSYHDGSTTPFGAQKSSQWASGRVFLPGAFLPSTLNEIGFMRLNEAVSRHR